MHAHRYQVSALPERLSKELIQLCIARYNVGWLPEAGPRNISLLLQCQYSFVTTALLRSELLALTWSATGGPSMGVSANS